MPEKYTEAKRVISAIAKSKIKAPLSGEIKLSIIFSFQNKVHGDLDNLAGTVMDALNKIAYKDDKQIYYLETVRIYSEDPESVTVTVSESDE